jgi:hypothetical protein
MFISKMEQISLRTGGEDNAKTHDAVSANGRKAVAICDTAVTGYGVPIAAANHAVRATSIAPSDTIIGCSVVIVMPVIQTPFRHITAHIINTQFIWGF